ncbi:MAG: putative heme iron utilization protein [Sulfurimonas sp.]|jgi:putative heme iron utilization protein|uniref:pyridoxamine 5'-phosphate oxidase family protein n=1 Tax=Sulfurimonas sp. TaxID=2022749 RepID=UPI0039E2DAA4
MRSTKTNEEIIEEFKTFENDKMSVVLSTVSTKNEPLTNYSPFVTKDGNYFICISSQLPHYINMIETQKAHALIIEDESKASNIYARKRLYFSVTCVLEEDTENIFKLFDARYGESLSFLREMKDFKVIKLIPSEKSLVLGFGAAYKMDMNGQLVSKNIQHKS